MTVEGLDVSAWQSTTPSLVGKAFLGVRATYGTSYDRMFATHAAAARAQGVIVLAYHFGRAGNVAAQVGAFLSHTADLYFLDLERDGVTSMSNTEAREFIRLVQATGRKIGLYHSASGYPILGQDFRWIAKWGTVPPALPWTFWQYDGSPLDRDRFPGSLSDLRHLAHPAPTAWTAHVPGDTDGSYRNFTVYHVSGDRVTSTRLGSTRGFTTSCTEPATYSWTGHPDQRLVELTSGKLYETAKALGITVAVRAVWAKGA